MRKSHWHTPFLHDLVDRGVSADIIPFESEAVWEIIEGIADAEERPSLPKQTIKWYKKVKAYAPRSRKTILNWAESIWPHTNSPSLAPVKEVSKGRVQVKEYPLDEEPPPPPPPLPVEEPPPPPPAPKVKKLSDMGLALEETFQRFVGEAPPDPPEKRYGPPPVRSVDYTADPAEDLFQVCIKVSLLDQDNVVDELRNALVNELDFDAVIKDVKQSEKEIRLLIHYKGSIVKVCEVIIAHPKVADADLLTAGEF